MYVVCHTYLREEKTVGTFDYYGTVSGPVRQGRDSAFPPIVRYYYIIYLRYIRTAAPSSFSILATSCFNKDTGEVRVYEPSKKQNNMNDDDNIEAIAIAAVNE